MSFQSVMLAKRKAPKATQTENEIREVLEGLPRYGLAAFLKLGLPARMPKEMGGAVLNGKVWLPPALGQEPELHDVIGFDLGKFRMKAAGVDQEGYLIDTMFIDAVCPAEIEKYEADGGKSAGTSESIAGKDTWQLYSVGNELQHLAPYWVSEDALSKTGNFTQGSIEIRCAEQRFRQLYCTGLATQLEVIGHPFTPIVEITEEELRLATTTVVTQSDESIREKLEMERTLATVPTRYLIISFGVPYEDLTPERKKTTGQALHTLPTDFVIARTNSYSSKKEICKVHVTDIYAYEQTRGTDEAVFTRPDGESAQDASSSKSTVRTYIDIGGGDEQKTQVTEDGSVVAFQGDYLGKGTIVPARALQRVTKRNHGVSLTEAAAQRAFYDPIIRGRGGRLIDLTQDIESLTEFDDLLARIEITDEMLSTLILYTGGGSAKLHDRIKTKMRQVSIEPKLREGIDFIAIPADICSITNVAGITLRGIFKAQGMEISFYTQFLNSLFRQFDSFLKEIPLGQWNLHTEVSTIVDQLYTLKGSEDFGQVRWPSLRQYSERYKQLREQLVPGKK